VDQKWHPLVESSRCGDTIAVIPLVDMLNHDPNAQCEGMFQKHNESYCVMAQSRSIREGEQLYVCYGPHDNARLWLEYGFELGEDNIFNRVNIPIELFIALAKRTKLVEVSEKHEVVLIDAALPCTIYASDEEPNYGLNKNCSILLLDQKQLPSWRDIIFNRELDEDIPDLNQQALLYAILEQLHIQLQLRAEKVVHVKIKSFWTDQILLVKRLLESRPVY